MAERGAWIPMRLGDFIRSRRTELLAEWERGLRLLPKANELSPRRRVDHIPEILDRIAESTDDGGDHISEHLANAPDEHALERLDEGFDLADVVREYALLRSVVLRHWEREVVGGAHPEEVVALDVAFDEAITASVSRYTRARDRTLIGLDRISDAALDDRGDLQAFLSRLLGVLMQTTEAVDIATIVLRAADDRMEVAASVGLDSEQAEPFSVAHGEGFAGKIALSLAPVELRDGAHDPLIQHPTYRKRGVRAVYGVPMIRRGEVVGVAIMGSITAFEFSNEDKVLFRTTVARATALIVQAQLADRERIARDQERAAHLVAAEAVKERERLHLIVDRERREYRALAESMPHFVWSARPDGGFGYFNQELTRYSGMPVEEAVDYGWQSLIWPGDLPITVERWSHALATGEPVQLEHRIRRKDGAYRWFVSRVVPLRDDAGAVVKWLGTSTDIDDRKREEERLRVLARTLSFASVRDEEEALRRLADLAVPDMADWSLVDAFGADGSARRIAVNHFNPERRALIEELRAYPPRAGGGQPPSIACATGQPVLVSRYGEADIATNAVDEEHAGILRRLEPRSLLSVPVIVNGRPIAALTLVMCERSGRRFTEDDRLLAVEVAARAAQAVERARAQEELAGALVWREQIIGILSHDLRNPLAAVTIATQQLLRQDLPDGLRRAVLRIGSAGTRMNNMVRDLLDFSQARFQRTLPIARQPVDLHAICRATIEELEVSHPERRIELRMRGERHGSFDPDRIAQVVSNLVGNALRYGDPQSPIQVLVDTDDGGLILTIRNQGPPIPPALLPQIFEPFRRGANPADASARGESLGLGLFIVREIVKAHGGTIDVTSSDEQGTAFTVRLPRA